MIAGLTMGSPLPVTCFVKKTFYSTLNPSYLRLYLFLCIVNAGISACMGLTLEAIGLGCVAHYSVFRNWIDVLAGVLSSFKIKKKKPKRYKKYDVTF